MKEFYFHEIIKLCEGRLFTLLKGIDHSLFTKFIAVLMESKEISNKLKILNDKKDKLTKAKQPINILGSQIDKDIFEKTLNQLENTINTQKHMNEKIGKETYNISGIIISTIKENDELYLQAKKILYPLFKFEDITDKPKVKQECPYVKVSVKQRRLDNAIRVTRLYKKYLKSIERKTTYDFLLGITHIDSLDIKKMKDNNK